MTNHPNHSPRKYLVTTISDTSRGLEISKVAIDLTRKEAFDIAKRAAGEKSEFTSHYGPGSMAYIGADVTAVISALDSVA